VSGKAGLSERDICTKFVTPALTDAGWDLQTQIREQVNITRGRVIVKGEKVSRDTPKYADYILYQKPNIPVAVIEAKDNTHAIGAGMQQALAYARLYDVPFVYSTNGDAFLEHDRTGRSDPIEAEIPLDGFPSPDKLWQRYRAWKELPAGTERIVGQGYYIGDLDKQPRYYQLAAINATIEAIAKGQDRILLVMATGTGKTYTAFQIIWRLWKSGTRKRILFLADRNILVDQTITNDFQPFGTAMTKIRRRQVNKSYEVYLALYQAVSGTEEAQNIYKQFSPDFFDLIVVDECHRGSAAEDAAWREILEYFASATQIGLTATPKETKYISNSHYFGEPVYVYSLRQGIDDGFLAPYRVIRVDLDRDLEGWDPQPGKVDRYGNPVERKHYGQKDFDRTLVLEQRTRLVAGRVSEFLEETDPYGKTIVFCEDIDHAERMRQQLVNASPGRVAENERYVVRITGDSPEGKAEVDTFIMPDSRYPVIATTSRLLSTGVDCQTCRLIVIDRAVESMIEFKQIIGRGTRINEEHGKYYFTVMDFRGVSQHFADPEFDGEPIEPLPEFEPGHERKKREEPGPELPKGVKYYINDVPVTVVRETLYYSAPDGRLITESLRDYTRKSVLSQYADLDAFLSSWSAAERKSAIVRELEAHGVLLDALAETVGRDYDPFDLVLHVAFDRPLRSRRQRAERAKGAKYFAEYGERARAVLEALLDKYAEEGIDDLESMEVLKVDPLASFGTPVEIVNGVFGGRGPYLNAIARLTDCLYATAEC
jgi:type I restriction enzyme R subunit